MRNWILSIMTIIVLAAAAPVLAGDAHNAGGHSDMSKPSMSGHDMTDGMKSESGKADMKDMQTFKHEAVVDGIKAEFQIMSLASMHMTDPQGRTHHIMVKLVPEGTDHALTDVEGKIKVIAPDKQAQTGVLKQYGDMLAASFTFDEPGKYGVICLFVADGQRHVVKFWYPHNK
jgi:hypothetical protein